MGRCSLSFHVLSKMNPESVSRGAPSQCCHYFGDYGFVVEPGETEVNENDVIAKNVNFTFSSHLNTLFVKRKEKCPFTISVSAPVPAGSIVKIILFAKSAKPQKDKGTKSKSVTRHPVMRCRHHSESEQDVGHVSPLHVVRSENADAVYECSEETGELSVSFPFRGASRACTSAENQMDIENLCFLCYSSCIKEDNKDNIFVKFSLEHRGVVIGSHVFGLHVCSSPGRDRYNHESDTNVLKKSRKREATIATEDTRIFEIKTRRKWIYDYLRKLNRGLELEEAIPLHIQERYLKSFHKKFDQQASTSQSSSSTSTSNSTNAANDVRLSLRRVLVR